MWWIQVERVIFGPFSCPYLGRHWDRRQSSIKTKMSRLEDRLPVQEKLSFDCCCKGKKNNKSAQKFIDFAHLYVIFHKIWWNMQSKWKRYHDILIFTTKSCWFNNKVVFLRRKDLNREDYERFYFKKKVLRL